MLSMQMSKCQIEMEKMVAVNVSLLHIIDSIYPALSRSYGRTYLKKTHDHLFTYSESLSPNVTYQNVPCIHKMSGAQCQCYCDDNVEGSDTYLLAYTRVQIMDINNVTRCICNVISRGSNENVMVNARANFIWRLLPCYLVLENEVGIVRDGGDFVSKLSSWRLITCMQMEIYYAWQNCKITFSPFFSFFFFTLTH